MRQLFANNFETTLSTPVAATGTSLSLASVAGLPTPVANESFFLLTLFKSSGGVEFSHDVVKVTGVSGTTLTVERNVEGQTAAAFDTGDPVELRNTALTMSNLLQQQSPDFGGSAPTNYTEHQLSVTATGATTTLDLASVRKFELSMQVSTTIAFGSVPAGDVTVKIRFIQDATGGRVLTLPSGTLTPGGSGIVLSTAANAIDDVVMEYDAANAKWSAYLYGKGMA